MSALFVHNPINPKLGRIVVLGQYMLYKDEILDLADIEEYAPEEFITSEWARNGEYAIIEDLFKNRIFKQQCKVEIEALYDELLNSDDVVFRAAVAINGERTEQCIKDKDAMVRRYAVKGHINKHYWDAIGAGAGFPDNIDRSNRLIALLTDEDASVREMLVYTGNPEYKAVLANDKEAVVRIAVVDESVRDESYLIKLADDRDESVRLAVASKGYHLPKHVIDKLITDDSVLVRRAIVRKCPVNEEDYPDLINDKNNEVRREIARRGIFLDTLIHDEDAEVRRLAESSIEEKAKWENDINNDSLIPF